MEACIFHGVREQTEAQADIETIEFLSSFRISPAIKEHIGNDNEGHMTFILPLYWRW